MKKLFCITLSIILLLSASACGTSPDDTSDIESIVSATDTPVQSTNSTESTTEATTTIIGWLDYTVTTKADATTSTPDSTSTSITTLKSAPTTTLKRAPTTTRKKITTTTPNTTTQDPNKIYRWSDPCDARGNGIPHKQGEANCGEYPACVYCHRTYTDANRHDRQLPNGICPRCSKDLFELEIVYPDVFTFDGYSRVYESYTMNLIQDAGYYDGVYLPDSYGIVFNFKLADASEKKPVESGYEFYIKVSFYDKNNNLLSAKTPSCHLTNQGGRIDYLSLPQSTVKVVLESIG